MTIADERVVADRQILGRFPRPRIGLRSARFLWGGRGVHGENRTLFHQLPSSAAAYLFIAQDESPTFPCQKRRGGAGPSDGFYRRRPFRRCTPTVLRGDRLVGVVDKLIYLLVINSILDSY